MGRKLDTLLKGFVAAKCLTLLKLATARIKVSRNQKRVAVRQMRGEIGRFLRSGQVANVSDTKIDTLIREENMVAAYDLIDHFCHSLISRFSLIDTQRYCPPDLKEPIASLIYAAPRCVQLAELAEIKDMLSTKYGKEFAIAADEIRPDCGVNKQIIELLSVRPASGQVKIQLMKEICLENNVRWRPDWKEGPWMNHPTDFEDEASQSLGARTDATRVIKAYRNCSSSIMQDGKSSLGSRHSGSNNFGPTAMPAFMKTNNRHPLSSSEFGPKHTLFSEEAMISASKEGLEGMYERPFRTHKAKSKEAAYHEDWMQRIERSPDEISDSGSEVFVSNEEEKEDVIFSHTEIASRVARNTTNSFQDNTTVPLSNSTIRARSLRASTEMQGGPKGNHLRTSRDESPYMEEFVKEKSSKGSSQEHYQDKEEYFNGSRAEENSFRLTPASINDIDEASELGASSLAHERLPFPDSQKDPWIHRQASTKPSNVNDVQNTMNEEASLYPRIPDTLENDEEFTAKAKAIAAEAARLAVLNYAQQYSKSSLKSTEHGDSVNVALENMQGKETNVSSFHVEKEDDGNNLILKKTGGLNVNQVPRSKHTFQSVKKEDQQLDHFFERQGNHLGHDRKHIFDKAQYIKPSSDVPIYGGSMSGAIDAEPDSNKNGSQRIKFSLELSGKTQNQSAPGFKAAKSSYDGQDPLANDEKGSSQLPSVCTKHPQWTSKDSSRPPQYDYNTETVDNLSSTSGQSTGAACDVSRTMRTMRQPDNNTYYDYNNKKPAGAASPYEWNRKEQVGIKQSNSEKVQSFEESPSSFWGTESGDASSLMSEYMAREPATRNKPLILDNDCTMRAPSSQKPSQIPERKPDPVSVCKSHEQADADQRERASSSPLSMWQKQNNHCEVEEVLESLYQPYEQLNWMSRRTVPVYARSQQQHRREKQKSPLKQHQGDSQRQPTPDEQQQKLSPECPTMPCSDKQTFEQKTVLSPLHDQPWDFWAEKEHVQHGWQQQEGHHKEQHQPSMFNQPSTNPTHLQIRPDMKNQPPTRPAPPMPRKSTFLSQWDKQEGKDKPVLDKSHEVLDTKSQPPLRKPPQLPQRETMISHEQKQRSQKEEHSWAGSYSWKMSQEVQQHSISQSHRRQMSQPEGPDKLTQAGSQLAPSLSDPAILASKAASSYARNPAASPTKISTSSSATQKAPAASPTKLGTSTSAPSFGSPAAIPKAPAASLINLRTSAPATLKAPPNPKAPDLDKLFANYQKMRQQAGYKP